MFPIVSADSADTNTVGDASADTDTVSYQPTLSQPVLFPHSTVAVGTDNSVTGTLDTDSADV